jgi:hypothetical protein
VSEDYVRPPIVAIEPPNQRAAVWRFRIVVLVLLLGLAVAIFFIAKAAIGGGEGNPGVGGGTLPVPRSATEVQAR